MVLAFDRVNCVEHGDLDHCNDPLSGRRSYVVHDAEAHGVLVPVGDYVRGCGLTEGADHSRCQSFATAKSHGNLHIGGAAGGLLTAHSAPFRPETVVRSYRLPNKSVFRTGTQAGKVVQWLYVEWLRPVLPYRKASNILATRWTPLILRELMADIHSFNDIHRGVPLISRAVLVARLRELENHGIVERRRRDRGSGYGYWLTLPVMPSALS